MFNWRRSSAKPPTDGDAANSKQRSIPLPLKSDRGPGDVAQLKNASGAATAPETVAATKPEFSRTRAMRSVDSLRRLVTDPGRSSSKEESNARSRHDDSALARTEHLPSAPAGASSEPIDTPSSNAAAAGTFTGTATEKTIMEAMSSISVNAAAGDGWIWSWFRERPAAPAPIETQTDSKTPEDGSRSVNNDGTTSGSGDTPTSTHHSGSNQTSPSKQAKNLKNENFKSDRTKNEKPNNGKVKEDTNNAVPVNGSSKTADHGSMRNSATDTSEGRSPGPASNGSAWAFWARRTTNTSETGDLAVSGTDTEHNPRNVEVQLAPPNAPPPPRETSKGSQAPPPSSSSIPPPSKRRKQVKPSLVIPKFDTIEKPSRTTKLARLLWASHPSYMNRARSPRVRRAVVIGVHGYFPARMTRAILGEPTGTSIKFANEGERMLRRWYAQHKGGTGNESDLHVDKIALEGEGKIAHRVERLYGLLQNWRQLIRDADFVFFAVHSQGAVVTVEIIERMIREGEIDARRQRIAVLSMAGSLLGPMPGMDQTIVMKAITRIEHDSLLELFELQRPDSAASQNFTKAIRSVLAAGVKVSLVGSADDQLIPLYSALAVHLRHPNLFRAVYMDGEDLAHDVVAPLLELSVRQMNAGVSERGVVAELSSTLAGALTSKGHSKLYSNDDVYMLGIRFALETSPVNGQLPEIDTEFSIPRAQPNPYLLPWAVQALVGDTSRSPTLAPVLATLRHEFDAWKPENKPLKDLKWRLNGLAHSKL